MALSDEVKARVSLREIVEQTVTWDRRKSNPARGEYWAPCPFHGEKTASFHITEPKGHGGQFYCFGCGSKGSVIDFIMARDSIPFTAAVRALADHGNIDRTADPARIARFKAESEARQQKAEDEAKELAERGVTQASRIWRASLADHPTLITYLEQGRGVSVAALGGIPPTLRLHPDLPCYEGDGGKRPRIVHRGPAMVGFIGRDRLVGVHLTWVDPVNPALGRARFANGIKVPKKFKGRTGEIWGQPVVLSKPEGTLVVAGEGIETTLAVQSATLVKNPGFEGRFEAALSLGALCGPEAKTGARRGKSARTGKTLPSPIPDLESPRPGWLPPAGVTRATILADPSTKCPESARLNAERAEAKAAHHCPHGARLAIPRGQWDHNDDFADLAKKGELNA
ncbi:hypothetical protein GFB49_11560 [Epibacterium sp. SM1979]|uniref:Zinc finger CHC2-type domain-containing protein n=1 Tax=Tritonibacter litoralis TaxID=2662264 RepID=A0A843YIP5_9RHOB|nr:CHC2 zinc finger domain-containing protein [Tritonibacter litoralis]MQQ09093.1 hypothetical protein [Tritonibacter litoralis]